MSTPKPFPCRVCKTEIVPPSGEKVRAMCEDLGFKTPNLTIIFKDICEACGADLTMSYPLVEKRIALNGGKV